VRVALTCSVRGALSHESKRRESVTVNRYALQLPHCFFFAFFWLALRRLTMP
jgi:hypothetical protein